MADVMTPLRLSLLQVVAKHPDLHRDKLLTLKGVQAEDLAFLEQHDLIREREPGCYRIAHLGQMALKRGRD
jgi:hypothetical protein